MLLTINFVKVQHIVSVKGQHLVSWLKYMLHGRDILSKTLQNGKMQLKQPAFS